MMLSSFLWAVTLAVLIGELTSFNLDKAAFRNRIDSLNSYMAEHYLPRELQTRLREYVHRSNYLHHEARYRDLIRDFSPLLRSEDCGGLPAGTVAHLLYDDAGGAGLSADEVARGLRACCCGAPSHGSTSSGASTPTATSTNTGDVARHLQQGAAMSAAEVAWALQADPLRLKRFDIADLHVIKFSLPRPQVQGARLDRDMHGASFAVLVQEVLEAAGGTG